MLNFKNIESKFYWLSLLMLLFSSVSARCGKEKSTGDRGNDNLPVAAIEYSITPDKTKTSLVSDKLMGFNLVYPHEKNAIWQDGKIAGYLKEVKVAFLRFPGGTVTSFYHWNAPTGEGWKDSWDPSNPVVAKAPTEFMDIDEYITLVKSTGAAPMVGINMSSGRRWNRINDGTTEALALMQYCRNKNFDVKYWFLDNEPYQHDSNGGAKTPEEYATLINTYAPLMKAYDPGIKIIVNWNAGFKNKRSEYEKIIQQAGANIDIIDVHWYWNWNNPSWESWLEKTPMEQWTGDTYAEDIAYFRQMVKDLGFPDIKLASLEWNSGPPKTGTFTTGRSALTQSEMIMQFISGGLDMAAFWPIHWPDESVLVRSFVNTANNTPNPNYGLFKFFGKMQGGQLIDYQITQGSSGMVSIVVKDPLSQTVRIGILNKNSKDIVTELRMEQFPEVKFKEAQSYTLNSDGTNYSLTDRAMLKSEKSTITKFISTGISLTLLTFEKL